MLTNYIRVALRLIRKNKIFSLINIFGLATGIACCMIIALYVQDELSYEKGFANHDNIYLINTRWSIRGNEETSAFSSPPIASDVARELPEVEAATRMMKPFGVEQHIVQYKEKTFFEKQAYFIDTTFLQVFPYLLKEGNSASALRAPYSMLISERLATKIFGSGSALNESVVINSADTFHITGVVASGPFPSHTEADLYMSLNSSRKARGIMEQTTWANNNMVANYVVIPDSRKVGTVEQKMAVMLEAKAGQELRDSGRKKSLSLQPLDDVRLYSNMKSGDKEGPGITYLYVICSIGVLILLLGCINFINLTTARSAQRAAEVGVRKSMGAFRSNLVGQFLGESFVIVLAAVVIGFVLLELLLPFVNPVIQKELRLTTHNLPFLLSAVAGIGALTALISGGYPAFYLSSLRPTQVLKGKAPGGGAPLLRKSLVVFQFVITISLISGIVIIQNQIQFMRTKSLGFDSGQLIVIPMRTATASTAYPALKSALTSMKGVNTVSAATSLPATPLFRDWGVYREGWTSDQALRHEVVFNDESYFKTLGVSLVAGRDFIAATDNSPADTIGPASIIVNEASIRAFDIPAAEAVGTMIYFQPGQERYEFRIIGVVRDFHQFSMHHDIVPMIFMYPGNQHNFPYIAVNIDISAYDAIRSEMKSVWERQVNSLPFEMTFADENIEKMYSGERRVSGLLAVSTLIAIVISGLGLYGLSVYVAERKTREIGIRKVAGATSADIVRMLSREYLLLIAISFAISVPIGYYVMDKWLQNFAFRIEPGAGVFLISGTIAFLVAWATVSFESFRAARKNPVETLRQD